VPKKLKTARQTQRALKKKEQEQEQEQKQEHKNMVSLVVMMEEILGKRFMLEKKVVVI